MKARWDGWELRWSAAWGLWERDRRGFSIVSSRKKTIGTSSSQSPKATAESSPVRASWRAQSAWQEG